jgi:hypothetical protein
MEIRVMQFLYSKIHPTFAYSQEMHNINTSIREFKIGARATLTREKGKIILKNRNKQIGGEIKETEIEGTKYEYNAEIGIPHMTDQKILLFLNITGTNENCALIMYDTIKSDGSTAILHGIMNDEDCIKCLDSNKKYKTGNILMQIVIKYIKNSKNLSHIKRIELDDASVKKCFDYGIRLIYLKMITHGETYYSKFGFKPKKVDEDYNENDEMTDYKIFKYNKKIFKTNRNLTNIEIIDVINNSELKKNSLLFYEKVLKLYLEENTIIDTSIFMKKIVNLAFDKNLNIDKKKPICNFINSIYKKLYKKIGYKKYESNIWALNV